MYTHISLADMNARELFTENTLTAFFISNPL